MIEGVDLLYEDSKRERRLKWSIVSVTFADKCERSGTDPCMESGLGSFRVANPPPAESQMPMYP